MKGVDELTREVATLRARMSRVSAAMLRIGATLDLDTILREAVGSACALTGASYGAITALDEAGQPGDLVASGLTEAARRQLSERPDAKVLLEYFRDLPRPLRVADGSVDLSALGLSSVLLPSKTLLGTPLRHRGVFVGKFCLFEKENEKAFSDEDEEVLVLFASQVGAAIANARMHKAERQARADLEALVETSPVGVVVFDAATGGLLSLNREAKRLVGELSLPGQSPEELLQSVAYQRADGRETALSEFPLSGQLSKARQVRAEEFVLSVPDGRSIPTLVNATPIRAEDGDVVSVVVTIQDLTPLAEVDRLRAEFVSMVSHELRAPLTSIKGSTATALGASPAPDPAEMREFLRIIDDQADRMRGLIVDLLDAGRIDTGTLSVSPEPSKVAGLVDEARNTFLSGGGRHAVLMDLAPDLPPAMADRRRIVQVLNNLLSNAARCSPETTPIRVAAERDGVHVSISVSDEGMGVAPELLPHLFRKYAGADSRERGIGRGYGLGLAICKGLVEAHGGRLWAESDGIDKGTRFTFTIPAAGDIAEDGPPGDNPCAPGKKREETRILVVDDDPQTLRYVRDALSVAGYTPFVTGDPQELPGLVRTTAPHLVLLDLVLPGTADGIELIELIPGLADLPVIFISGYGRDETVAKALDAGAADYIVKPFSPTELTARVRAALRRRMQPEPFFLGDLAIHYEQRRVSMAGRAVRLTPTEYELLRVLSVNAGRVSTYDFLVRQVWGGREHGDPELVRAFIKKLRGKLGDSARKPAYILNERGVGYRMPLPGESL